MKFGLPENSVLKIKAVFEKYPEVETAILYGSRAKGNYRAGSDIDLTLKGDELTNNLLYKIKQELDDLNTPYLFDISLFAGLNSPDLEDHINRIGAVFYSKTPVAS